MLTISAHWDNDKCYYPAVPIYLATTSRIYQNLQANATPLSYEKDIDFKQNFSFDSGQLVERLGRGIPYVAIVDSFTPKTGFIL